MAEQERSTEELTALQPQFEAFINNFCNEKVIGIAHGFVVMMAESAIVEGLPTSFDPLDGGGAIPISYVAMDINFVAQN